MSRTLLMFLAHEEIAQETVLVGNSSSVKKNLVF